MPKIPSCPAISRKQGKTYSAGNIFYYLEEYIVKSGEVITIEEVFNETRCTCGAIDPAYCVCMSFPQRYNPEPEDDEALVD